jgi:hypothetical protein
MNGIRVTMSLIIILHLTFFARSADLDTVRNNFEKAVNDKEVCLFMIEQLSKETESAVHIAYLGAYETIMANHLVNPISKLQTFNKGKKKIEAAVQADKHNIEIRFVRLTIQMNCPAFLGYNKNKNEDRQLIHSGINNIQNKQLKEMMSSVIE